MDNRPKWQMSVPFYLSDYDLSGPGAQSKLQTAVMVADGVSAEQEASEHPTTRSPSPPISQSFDMMTLSDDEEQEQAICKSLGQATRE